MNHALNTGLKGSTRDIGLDPSEHRTAGKGDASRISNLTRFKNHLDEIDLPRVPCADDPTFKRTKRGFKKVYGQRDIKPDVAEEAPPVSSNEVAPEL